MEFPSNNLVNHSAPLDRRDQARDRRRRQVSRDVAKGCGLQLQRPGVFERRGNLENELVAVWCVHVKIAFALPGSGRNVP